MKAWDYNKKSHGDACDGRRKEYHIERANEV